MTPAAVPRRDQARLAELVAALSLGVDLGFGQPMEHVLRECLIALRLADRLGLDDAERSTVYYTALLVNVGCHADAHEQAKWFGDDIALRSGKYDHEQRSLLGAVASLRLLGSGNPPLHRFRVGLEFALSGYRALDGMIARHSALARALAEGLGLPPAVQEAVGASYERWDGRGWPGALAGEEIPVAARLSQLAEYVEVAHRIGGVEAALALARRQARAQFDPSLSAILCADPETILGGLESTRTWEAVIDAEPALRVHLTPAEFDQALLAAETGRQLGLPEDEVRTLRRAGLVHDLGRLGVSNAIWDKEGPLGTGEWERVRMHPYLTERMLHQSTSLAPLAAIVVQHRERLDGSGYPRGLAGSAISGPARILGAVDAYQSMCEERPHRPARTPAEAADELRSDVEAGRLDPDAAAAVLTAAGHRVTSRRERPAGLTAREVDVLRLLARGLSSKEIAARLVISPKTARNHIEHIYAKIGTSSRVTACLFAVQNGLLADETFGSV